MYRVWNPAAIPYLTACGPGIALALGVGNLQKTFQGSQPGPQRKIQSRSSLQHGRLRDGALPCKCTQEQDVEHLGTVLPLVLHVGTLLIPSSPDFHHRQNNLGEGCCPVVNCLRAELTAWLCKVILLGEQLQGCALSLEGRGGKLEAQLPSGIPQ